MFRQMHASTLQNRHLQPGVAVLIMANTAYVVLWPPLPRRFAIRFFCQTVRLFNEVPDEVSTYCVLSAFAHTFLPKVFCSAVQLFVAFPAHGFDAAL